MAQLCPVLDNKANIDDINRVFQELHQELLLKASLSDLKQLRQKQTLVNESLCQENITGRWLWKSGSLRSGHSVAWDSQVINTLPDNFAFTKGGSQITVHTQGLYMVCFGFYSTKKPTIQLLLNGEPLLSAVNSNSYVVHHSAGKLKDLQHSTGNVTGTSPSLYPRPHHDRLPPTAPPQQDQLHLCRRQGSRRLLLHQTHVIDAISYTIILKYD